MRKLVLFLSLLFLFMSLNAQTEVKGLKLKYVLFESAYELYNYNVKKIYFYRIVLLASGKDGREYKNFLKETYSRLPDTKKKQLCSIFEVAGAWYLMNLTSQLPDSSNIDSIINFVISDKKLQNISNDFKEFFKYYYQNGFKDYFNYVSPKCDLKVIEAKKDQELKTFNFIDFMEMESGIKFSKKYKVEFYYTLSFTSAFGFSIDSTMISTIQMRTCINDIYSTVFHEFSHELFQTFTKSTRFKELSDSLRNNKKLKNGYNNMGKYAYHWEGWIEENLVNGFAAFLDFKRNVKNKKRFFNYPYDEQFFNYLISNQFHPDNKSLSMISYEFLNIIKNE